MPPTRFTTASTNLLSTALQVQLAGGGAAMTNDYRFGDEAADTFFRKFGDITGDRSVNLFDFAAFRAATEQAVATLTLTQASTPTATERSNCSTSPIPQSLRYVDQRVHCLASFQSPVPCQRACHGNGCGQTVACSLPVCSLKPRSLLPRYLLGWKRICLDVIC